MKNLCKLLGVFLIFGILTPLGSFAEMIKIAETKRGAKFYVDTSTIQKRQDGISAVIESVTYDSFGRVDDTYSVEMFFGCKTRTIGNLQIFIRGAWRTLDQPVTRVVPESAGEDMLINLCKIYG